MARPARVRMRRRKPWVLARRRLFGWNVRLLTRVLQLGMVLGIAAAAVGWHRQTALRYGREVSGSNRPSATRRAAPCKPENRLGPQYRWARVVDNSCGPASDTASV